MDNPYQAPSERGGQAVTRVASRDRSRRPTSATIFGRLNIVIGLFALLNASLGLLRLYEDLQKGPTRNPLFESRLDPGYRTISLVTIPLGMVAGAVLVGSGIGLLRGEPWGRTLALGYAYYGIVAAVIGALVNYTHVIKPAIATFGAKPDPQLVRAVIVEGMIVGLRFVYPILLHVFMARPSLARALAPPVRKVPGSDWDFTLPSKRT